MSEQLTSDELNDDLEKRRKLVHTLAEFQEWQNLAASKGWKLPGGSSLPRESWIHYWKGCDAYERGLSKGRPVVPHRSA